MQQKAKEIQSYTVNILMDFFKWLVPMFEDNVSPFHTVAAQMDMK